MASGRGEKALAAQGSERPLGESTSTRDVTEMKCRVQCPLGTGKVTVFSPSVSEIASTPSPSPGTSKYVAMCTVKLTSLQVVHWGQQGP